MDRYPYVLGCLLGTAVGDAVGLRREGLSRRRAERLYGKSPLAPALIFGRGFCSDDTEHTQMVGRALAVSAADPIQFERQLASQLKCWLLTIPAGVGLATLRACLKLLIGCRPSTRGVYSAGNGPAMRAALLGVCAESDTQLAELVRVSTRMTHTDPKAEEGALLVARAARLKVAGDSRSPIVFLTDIVNEIEGDELSRFIKAACAALCEGESSRDFADSQGWERGISGYVNHTVPAALYCWAKSPNDFRHSVEQAVLLGGDSDTVAAITGAICGANLGADGIPQEWIDHLAEWPKSVGWMAKLSRSISDVTERREPQEPPSMHWPATFIRNLFFAAVVLSLGFRRLLPPY